MLRPFPESFREFSEPTEKKDTSYPIISFGELISVDLSGGAYRGFVSTDKESRFYDFWTERKSYYSQTQNRIIQIKIETESTDISGNNPLMPYQIGVSLESLTNELILGMKFQVRYKREISGPPVLLELRNFSQQIHRSLCKLLERWEAEISVDKIRDVIAKHSNTYCVVEEEL